MHKKRGRILWVDDEIQHLKPHILFLEEKGYELFQVNNGQDAVELSKNKVFDLVLLDQSMPGLDGLATLAELKKIRQNQIVIMITKTEDEWLMDEAINSQIEQYLIKPLNSLGQGLRSPTKTSASAFIKREISSLPITPAPPLINTFLFFIVF